MNPEIIGISAGIISCITFLPQVIKTWKSKSASDISPAMFVLASAGTVLWLIYGMMIQSFSVIFTNCVVFVLSIIMVVLYIKYK